MVGREGYQSLSSEDASFPPSHYNMSTPGAKQEQTTKRQAIPLSTVTKPTHFLRCQGESRRSPNQKSSPRSTSFSPRNQAAPRSSKIPLFSRFGEAKMLLIYNCTLET